MGWSGREGRTTSRNLGLQSRTPVRRRTNPNKPFPDFLSALPGPSLLDSEQWENHVPPRRRHILRRLTHINHPVLMGGGRRNPEGSHENDDYHRSPGAMEHCGMGNSSSAPWSEYFGYFSPWSS